VAHIARVTVYVVVNASPVNFSSHDVVPFVCLPGGTVPRFDEINILLISFSRK
jgi:hypothetical protein